MGNNVYIGLLNPAISLSLAGAFFMLWFHQRQKPYIFDLAIGYACVAIGFTLQYLVLPIGFELTKVCSNIFFLSAGYILAAAIFRRYDRRVPWTGLAILAVGGFAAFLWFMFVTPNLAWRILVTNASIGGMALIAAARLWRERRKNSIEMMLFIITLASALNLTVRPLVALQLVGLSINYEDLYHSLYWTTALLSHALLSLLLALCLLTAAALDVVKALKNDSETDVLSGLLNRRGFQAAATDLLRSQNAARLPVALILADLDHFKLVNDRYGHEAGDRVIAHFATLIRKSISPESVAGRLGGEEFAVLLPICDAAAARLFAEGIRTAIAAETAVTASFGIATNLDNDDLLALLRRADSALYAAKSAGRNQVFYLEDRPPEMATTFLLATG